MNKVKLNFEKKLDEAIKEDFNEFCAYVRGRSHATRKLSSISDD